MENENFENPVYASAVSARPKEPPPNTDTPQVVLQMSFFPLCLKSEELNCEGNCNIVRVLCK